MSQHQAKHKSTLNNGRSSTTDFSKCFSKSFTVEVLTSEAFRRLPPSAMTVCLLMFVKIDNSKYHKRRTPEGKPVIELPKHEGAGLLGLSEKTLAEALRRVEEHGIADRHKQGGLLGANGESNKFTPSDRWKNWKPTKPHRGRENIKKARAALPKKPGTHG